MPLLGPAAIPPRCFAQILLDPSAITVIRGETALRGCVAVIRSQSVPSVGLFVVLRHPESILVDYPEIALRESGMPSRCPLQQFSAGLDLSNTDSTRWTDSVESAIRRQHSWTVPLSGLPPNTDTVQGKEKDGMTSLHQDDRQWAVVCQMLFQRERREGWGGVEGLQPGKSRE